LVFTRACQELVRDSSAVPRLFVRLAGAVGRQSALHKENSGSAHFHVSWLSDFIFYPKPLYKSLHQSFFYSFITILLSESGVTFDYCTIFPYTLSFRHFTFTFKHLSHDFEKTTITAMYHGRWFAYMILPCPKWEGGERNTCSCG
jgi:hypothetical protein